MHKTHRHRLIARLLQANPVRSQEQLRDLLLASGVRSTQGTLSRDLREMGVLKAPTGYTLAVSGPGRRIGTELESAVQQHMVSAEAAGNVIILKTEPGHASLLAGHIDLATIPGIIGTVAGDDTVIVAARTPKDARNAALQLQKLGGIL